MLKLILAVFCVIFFSACQSMKLSRLEPQNIPNFIPPKNDVKIALILGGGGSKGLAHVGVIKELEDAGIHPDLIVGCSSGAIIGAFYADQPDIARIHKMLMSIKKSDLMDFSLFFSKFGVVKGKLLTNFISKNLKAKIFSDLNIPFIAVATDLRSGELVELGVGDLVSSIKASAAVPGVFNPVLYKGRYLVDGGVVDPIPVRIAKKYGAKVIIAVDVGSDVNDHEPNHFLGIAKRSLEISLRKLSEYVTRDADITLRMNFNNIGMFTDSYNKEIFEHGRKVTRIMLPEIQKQIYEKLQCEKEESEIEAN